MKLEDLQRIYFRTLLLDDTEAEDENGRLLHLGDTVLVNNVRCIGCATMARF